MAPKRKATEGEVRPAKRKKEYLSSNLGSAWELPLPGTSRTSRNAKPLYTQPALPKRTAQRKNAEDNDTTMVDASMVWDIGDTTLVDREAEIDVGAKDHRIVQSSTDTPSGHMGTTGIAMAVDLPQSSAPLAPIDSNSPRKRVKRKVDLKIGSFSSTERQSPITSRKRKSKKAASGSPLPIHNDTAVATHPRLTIKLPPRRPKETVHADSSPDDLTVALISTDNPDLILLHGFAISLRGESPSNRVSTKTLAEHYRVATVTMQSVLYTAVKSQAGEVNDSAGKRRKRWSISESAFLQLKSILVTDEGRDNWLRENGLTLEREGTPTEIIDPTLLHGFAISLRGESPFKQVSTKTLADHYGVTTTTIQGVLYAAVKSQAGEVNDSNGKRREKWSISESAFLQLKTILATDEGRNNWLLENNLTLEREEDRTQIETIDSTKTINPTLLHGFAISLRGESPSNRVSTKTLAEHYRVAIVTMQILLYTAIKSQAGEVNNFDGKRQKRWSISESAFLQLKSILATDEGRDNWLRENNLTLEREGTPTETIDLTLLHGFAISLRGESPSRRLSLKTLADHYRATTATIQCVLYSAIKSQAGEVNQSSTGKRREKWSISESAFLQLKSILKTDEGRAEWLRENNLTLERGEVEMTINHNDDDSEWLPWSSRQSTKDRSIKFVTKGLPQKPTTTAECKLMGLQLGEDIIASRLLLAQGKDVFVGNDGTMEGLKMAAEKRGSNFYDALHSKPNLASSKARSKVDPYASLTEHLWVNSNPAITIPMTGLTKVSTNKDGDPIVSPRDEALLTIQAIEDQFLSFATDFMFPEGPLTTDVTDSTLESTLFTVESLVPDALNAQIIEYAESLMQLQFALEGVDIHGFDDVRRTKKYAIDRIQQEINQLNDKVYKRLMGNGGSMSSETELQEGETNNESLPALDTDPTIPLDSLSTPEASPDTLHHYMFKIDGDKEELVEGMAKLLLLRPWDAGKIVAWLEAAGETELAWGLLGVSLECRGAGEAFPKDIKPETHQTPHLYPLIYKGKHRGLEVRTRCLAHLNRTRSGRDTTFKADLFRCFDPNLISCYELNDSAVTNHEQQQDNWTYEDRQSIEAHLVATMPALLNTVPGGEILVPSLEGEWGKNILDDVHQLHLKFKIYLSKDGPEEIKHINWSRILPADAIRSWRSFRGSGRIAPLMQRECILKSIHKSLHSRVSFQSRPMDAAKLQNALPASNLGRMLAKEEGAISANRLSRIYLRGCPKVLSDIHTMSRADLASEIERSWKEHWASKDLQLAD